MHLLAAAPDDARPAVLIAWLAGSAVAILLASFVQAPLLLAACALSRLPDVRFGRAWGTVLVCNLVFWGFLTFLVLGVLFGQTKADPGPVRVSYTFIFQPINFIYLFVAQVLGHALIFSPRLADPDEPAIGFGRSAGVAVVYVGLCSAVGAVVFVAYALATAGMTK
jgi:hypothetical protein